MVIVGSSFVAVRCVAWSWLSIVWSDAWSFISGEGEREAVVEEDEGGLGQCPFSGGPTPPGCSMRCLGRCKKGIKARCFSYHFRHHQLDP